MSQKGQGERGQDEKPRGGPPVPPPPRRHRTSAPPVATSGDATSAFDPPPPMVVRRRWESPTRTSRVARPTTSPEMDPVVPPPRNPIAPGPYFSENVPESGHSTPRRKSRPNAGTIDTSSQMAQPIRDDATATGSKATRKRVNIREASADVPPRTKPDYEPSSSPVRTSRRRSLSPDKTYDPVASAKATLRDPGASTSARVPQSTHRVSPPMSSDQTATYVKSSRRRSLSPVKTFEPVASSQATPQDNGPSTSARVEQSGHRDSLPTSSPQTTTDFRRASPLVTIQEAGPSTSAGGLKMATTRTTDTKEGLKQRLFKKKASETPGPSSQQARRPSMVSVQNKSKTNRILYSTDEEVRAALIEFTVFIIFLILTSLVTLSVRHSYMFYFNDTMKKLFTTRDLVIAPSVTVNFEKQITVPDWWDYLVYNFLITLHGDLTLMDGSSEESNTTTTTPPGNVADKRAPSGNTNTERAGSYSEYSWDPGEDSKIKRQAPSPWGSMPVPKPGLHYSEKTDRQNTTDHHLKGRIFLYENLLLGPPRIRQIRVRKESCYVNDAFIRYFNSCYAAYSRSSEDRTKFQGIPYQTMSSLDTMPIWTVLAFYRTGGYVVNLTYVKDTNLAIITDLKNNHWLDRGSRLCLVEFNLFNDNTDIFQSIKLIAEIPPTGGVIPQAHMQTVKQHSFFTDVSMVMSVIYIFWYIMVIYYTIYEINEIRKSGCRNYIFSIMNMLDCIILLLCYLALVYNIWHSWKIRSVTIKAMNEYTYQSLDVLCFWNIIYVDMMAILAFLVWIKIFKFISFNKTLVQFTTTLKRCSKDLAGFSLMFGIVFLAYAQLGLLLFGTKHPDFRNFITSILTMIRMILGDFQYNLIEQANRVLGPIYFLTYILLVFFILLNMFLAIIMETYNTVKSEITHGSSQLGSYIYKKALALLYFIIHCGRKRKVNQRAAEGVEEEAKEEPEVLQKNLTATEARYFQEIPPGENKELVRLTNRVSLLEEILEKLITNMDDILKRVEKEREHRRK